MKKLLMFFSLVGLFVVGACGKTTTITTQTTTTTTSKQTTTTTEEEVKNPSLIYRKSIALKDDNVPLKVIQYADLHFGIEGTTYHNDKENRTKKYMKAMIEEKQPDLIVCSGDNILGTGIEGLKKFVAHMESLETPWVFMYGNHDHEGSSSKKVFNKYLTEADTKYLIYEEGFVDEKENRYGNFSLQILNQKETKLLGALFFLDAGTYDYGLADYQAIIKAQIEWYKTEVDFYQYVYMGQKNNAHEIVPSIVFSHIQLPEFETAYTAAKSNSGNAEFIIPQDVNASSIGGSAPKVNTGFYDVLKYSRKPFVASHSNARSVCPAARNLTDDMIKKLSEAGGVTGLNFCKSFLAAEETGKPNPYTLEVIAKHARHITNLGGMECLGLGSDFDGIATNEAIPNATYMPKLYETLKKEGFSESDLEKIFYQNVLRVYKENF